MSDAPVQLRAATTEDVEEIDGLIHRAMWALGARDYTPRQIDSILKYAMGVDTQLIRDGTYFVAADARGRIVAAGGWSFRRLLHGGDGAKRAGDDVRLDPGTDAARIRAFFVEPAHARRGIGRRIVGLCERAAANAGFARMELASTLTGVNLYRACGFDEIERAEATLPDGVAVQLVRMAKTITPIALGAPDAESDIMKRDQPAREATMAENYRTERDSMGEMKVPADAHHGAQTARAVENFPISDLRFPRRFIAAMGLIKWAAAQVNHDLGLLDEKRRGLLQQAAQEVVDGKLDAHFVLDIFQTGSGTSTNMNANEVISSRANEIATGKRGGKEPIHPNDHVNMQQSSNDVIPTAMHISAAVAMKESLVPALEHLARTLDGKAKQFDDIVKIGRTHLQDATPIRLGQELSGYAAQAHLSVLRANKAINALRELPLGGTAVGTGINSHPDYAKKAIAIIAQRTGIDFVEAKNHFEAQAAKDAIVEASGQLKTIAVSMTKIANDIRWLASGPRCGIGEISIPATQPGSSIMPGKVNPVMSEMMLMVCAQVIGNDATIALAGSGLGSTFELNVMMPVMAYNILQSIDLLAQAARVFADRTVAGIEANRERCESLVEQSLAMCTSLAPVIGYDKAADIAKESFKTGKTVRQIALERKVMDEASLKKALDAHRMTQPQADMVGSGGG